MNAKGRLDGPWTPTGSPHPASPQAYPVLVEDEDAVDGAEESWGDSKGGTQRGLGWGLGDHSRVGNRVHSPRTDRAATNFMLCL